MLNHKGIKRDQRGRFKPGTKPGPGRPRVENKKDNVRYYDYKELRRAWLLFRFVNKGFISCQCGNTDPSEFHIQDHPSEGMLRAKCLKCGRWHTYYEEHNWFVPDLPARLSREDAGGHNKRSSDHQRNNHSIHGLP